MNSYVLITGASGGIGRATAHALAAEGKNLILIARRKDKLEELKAELSGQDIDVRIEATDVTDEEAVKHLFASLDSVPLEAVINNAGLALGKDPLQSTSFEDSKAMIDVNITAFLHVLRLSLPLLAKTQGHMVVLGSIAGQETYEGGAVYCGTKHFVKAAAKGARIDMAGTGVRVTEIAPGAVKTDFSKVRFKGDESKADSVYEGYEPLHPEDIADVIRYALSRPKHVNIEHMLVMPTAQASATRVAKSQ